MVAWVQERCERPNLGAVYPDKSFTMDWASDHGFYSLCEPDGRLEPDVGQRITHVKFNPTGQIAELPAYITVKVGDGWYIEAGL